MGAGTLGFPRDQQGGAGRLPGMGDAALDVRGWPQFPGTDRLARWRPEMPGRARRLDPPVGGQGPRFRCVQPSPAAPRPPDPTPGPRELGTQDLAGSSVSAPVPRASCILGNPSPLPSSGSPSSPELGPLARARSPLLPSLSGLLPTNEVERCRWNEPGVEGSLRIPFPRGAPAGLPPVRPPALGCVWGAECGGSLKPPGKRTRAFCSPIPSQVPS